VQTMLKDTIDSYMQYPWVKSAVGAVNLAFPFLDESDPQNYKTAWVTCQRYFSQAIHCATLIKDSSVTSPEAMELLTKLGKYWSARGKFDDAERLFQQALAVKEQLIEPTHPFVAMTLYEVARFYHDQSNHERAESFFREALAIRQQVVQSDNVDMLKVLTKYATLLRQTGKEDDALKLEMQAKVIRNKHPQMNIDRTTINDNDPAIIYDPEGAWEYQHPGDESSAEDYFNDVHYTRTPGSFFQYTFRGTGIDVITNTRPGYGNVSIFIDDYPEEVVDTAVIADQVTQALLFQAPNLVYGEHTMKVVLNSGTFVLDALAVYS
jgi:tetratricopeptide (TPR) repeat protein